MEPVYLDNNATTIVDPRVKEAMEPFFMQMYGNTNSLHSFGMEVHPYMRIAFDRLYAGIGAGDDDDVIINSCATEGNNTVLKGVFYELIASGKKTEIVTTQVEHPCIMGSARFLQSLGATVHFLPVNDAGVVDTDILREYINADKTALVSIMWANNETGLIFPIRELAELCREHGILFHTDAAQAIGKLPVDVSSVPLDFLTFSGHKFHAPKGVGGLYIRRGVQIPPLLHGGEQMSGKRAGTVDVAGLVGMGMAMELAVQNLEFEEHTVRTLRDKLEDAILAIDGAQVIGDRAMRTPNTILASFRGVEGEAMIWDLNRQGIAASTGSACASEDLEPNPTFIAMGVDSELAHTGVRLSLSRFTTAEEIDYAAEKIAGSVARLRAISAGP